MAPSDVSPSLRVTRRLLRSAALLALLIASYHAVQLTNPEFTVNSSQLQSNAPATGSRPELTGPGPKLSPDDVALSLADQRYHAILVAERAQGRAGLWRMGAIALLLLGSDFVVARRRFRPEPIPVKRLS